MRILLTNDDGIHAPGIHALWRVFEDWADIFVVAPDTERSATGHGITVHQPLRVEKLTFANPRVRGWAVNGTPADCVKLAMEELMEEPPHIVVSGINRGPNLGTDVLYSGTVSAAMEGVIYGIPSIAVSVTGWQTVDYTVAAETTRLLCEKLVARGLTPDTFLNVNVPDLPRERIGGIEVTKLGSRRYQNIFDKRTDPRGRVYYWMAGEVHDVDAGEGTDIQAVNSGAISVTPIHFDLTNYSLIQEVSDWLCQKTAPVDEPDQSKRKA